LPPLPALTRAEGELIDRYLEAVDLLGRINPAQYGDTYRGLRAAQALVAKAAELRDALALMHQRARRSCTPPRWRVRCACWTENAARLASRCPRAPTVDDAYRPVPDVSTL
jgi:hypothetical protein